MGIYIGPTLDLHGYLGFRVLIDPPEALTPSSCDFTYQRSRKLIPEEDLRRAFCLAGLRNKHAEKIMEITLISEVLEDDTHSSC